MKTIFLLTSILVSICSNAQTAIKWSQEFKDEPNELPGKLLYDDGQYLYVEKDVIRPGGAYTSGTDKISKISIIKFDYEMHLVKSGDFTLDLKNNEELLQIKNFGNSIIIFTKLRDYDKDITELCALRINKETLIAEGARTVFLHDEGSQVYEDKSNDSLHYVALVRKGKSSPSKYIVYDQDLKSSFQHEIMLQDSFTILRDWGARYVNPRGVLFIAAREIYSEKIQDQLKKAVKGETYFTNIQSVPYLYVITSKGEISKYPITSNEKWVEEKFFKADGEGNVIYSALYQLNDAKKKPYAVPVEGGIVYMKFDSNGKPVNAFTTPFSDKLISDLNVYHGKENDRSLPAAFSIDQLLQKGDKIYLFLTDDNLNFYTGPKTFGNLSTGQGAVTTEDRTSNECVLLCLDNSGSENWHAIIPKKQVLTSEKNYDYGSQVLLQKGEGFCVIYNDLEPNIALTSPSEKELKKFNGKKDAVITTAEINANGTIKKSKWDQSSLEGKNIYVARSKQTRDNRFFIYYYDDEKKVKKFGLSDL